MAVPQQPERQTSPERPDSTEPEAHGLLVQAPIAPLDENGLVAIMIGTVAFAVVALVLGLGYDRLAAAGEGWWLAVAIAGSALGVIGLLYCWRRRSP